MTDPYEHISKTPLKSGSEFPGPEELQGAGRQKHELYPVAQQEGFSRVVQQAQGAGRQKHELYPVTQFYDTRNIEYEAFSRMVQEGPGPDTEEMSWSSTPSVSRRVSRIVAQGPGPDTEEMSWSSMLSNKTFCEFHEHCLTQRYLHQKTERTEAVDRYKMSIKQKYIQDEDQSLAKLYTEPVIVQKMRNGGFKNVHVDELFEPKSPFHEPIVILQGNSGSGKSYIAQKILLDWASGERYHKFDLVFYLRCEELVCVNEEMSLFELLSWSCSLTSDQISQMLEYSSSKVLFLVDGFVEFRFLRHDFYRLHPSAKVPPEVLVSALLRGYILPRSTLMITTRTKVPQGTLLKTQQPFTKIMGFSEKKIEEYFQKFFQDEDLFRKAYSSVKASETLFTACSSPLICWIVCTVIRERFKDGSDVTSGLETTTSIYVDLVSTVLEQHCQGLSESVPILLKSLGQLAERGVMEQQVLFDERTVKVTVQDPLHNPFLNKFLLEKRIQLEAKFRFMHLSFQEFFTALYYVLLDEDESQKKVRELLHAVERGWALSCWSVADSEIRSSKQLQPVILFLWGFYKNKSINSFFEKHNVIVPVNIETQLKEWIHQCSQRYQHENMLFILHCLHELHDKSFTGKVLEGLILIDLSNIPLNCTDCSVLRFCLQCCQHIKNLRLKITSDNLKILQPALCSCEELCMKVCKKGSQNYSEIIASAKDGDLTLSVRCSKSKRKSPLLLSQLTLTCSHTETQILEKLQLLPRWRMSMFIERDKKSLTEEGLKTGKREKKVFTPNLTDDESKGENTHRFVSPHAGQFKCSLTNLVFVMEGKGEMLYKMVPWDPCRLDALIQMEPAGPLYDINCSKGSVSQLHLPHCEILTESVYVDKHRPQLIQKVTSVMEIADCFMSQGMIRDEMYNRVNTAETRQKKMRIFFDVLESGGTRVKAEFWKLLKEKEPHLVDELESGH
ncbi:NACHT, LRR and PYD domains-containing protein 3 [Triplophysa tibetana]|uniref:NACHT, LRR and PYD domains-containing protein 3 n=1 Tax=Triplophysa tibetana TaxID=1572043 RepID=A0A5A9P9Y9_9TELE|nr:NACHT, LRR and PYD domains-containing protein 3 [Triplophysa tibetana]